ncbi:ParC family partition-associated protein [Nitrosospira sp. NpAV]|uniref:ParC family partition-associated protein n=1 Tax=Nitrosospira sp. NpAV TaxID=58133 RepID=UPI0005A06D95|nr:ParC family partition-associated protein [Nitrosospira sp. NpAV]KIO48653.1 partition protein C [Nitrosospira sp. NpAV]
MLTTTAKVVEPKVLKELVAAGSVTSAHVESGDKGLVIVVRAGMNERVLGAARGGLRYFQSLDGAASVLQGYGIMRFHVDIAHWVPKTMVRGYKSAPAATADSDVLT